MSQSELSDFYSKAHNIIVGSDPNYKEVIICDNHMPGIEYRPINKSPRIGDSVGYTYETIVFSSQDFTLMANTDIEHALNFQYSLIAISVNGKLYHRTNPGTQEADWYGYEPGTLRAGTLAPIYASSSTPNLDYYLKPYINSSGHYTDIGASADTFKNIYVDHVIANDLQMAGSTATISLDNLQEKLTAGDNISITSSTVGLVISAEDSFVTYNIYDYTALSYQERIPI